MQKSAFHYIVAALVLLTVATAPVVAQSSKSVYRVAADATADGDGSSWETAMPLAAALEKAKAGDEVWVKGYEQLTADNYYYAPAAGFQLRSGVRLYGGLAGTETTTAEAAAPKSGTKRYSLTYQSVLLGDTKRNDSIPANYIIFPENPTRTDNARHCLVVNLGVSDDNLNDANLTTIVSGLVLAGGNASGAENSDAGHGGGILIVNRSSRSDDGNASKRAYEVTQCYFVNNYASRGGAVYVDPTVTNNDSYTNRIRYCGIYNNVAGTRSSNVSCGGGVWLGGSAVLCNSEVYNNTGGGIRLSDRAKVVNTTVVHNTVSAVDLTDSSLQSKVPTSNGGGALYNTVMWGSTTLAKTETKPAFRNCAFPEMEYDDEYGNLEISTNNFSSIAPAAAFTTPTSDIGYDRSFSFTDNIVPIYSFEPMDGSTLIDNGDDKWYTNYVSSAIDNDLDVMGSHRHYTGNSVDIGAVEHEVLAAGRRLYVKTAADGGSNSNDGTSWDNALADPQTAIDRLYGDGTRGKGEVWVAKGEYVPQSYIKSDVDNSQTTPLAFQMRNGISVYGGFRGDETKSTERELDYEGGMMWQFVNPTIFRGADYTDGSVSWNTTEEMWNVSSKSYHVVWFAANPYDVKKGADAEFSLSTVLDGVTVEGGAASENGDPSFAPNQGAGIYMAGSNNVVRRCVVRNNNAGMKATANGTPQGGGIYNMGGQVRYSLVYNNSAAEGGGVYIAAIGFVNNSMLANNSSVNGSGLYIDRSFAMQQYQVAAVNIITNNTSTGNGAVYVKGDGVVEQNTIANNYTSNVTDETGAGVTSYTGGLFITGAATVINNIIYNNSLRQTAGSGSKLSTESMAQVYAYRPSRDSTLFYNNAISDVNSTAWNGIYQSGTYELTTNEFQLGTATQYASADDIANLRGVQSSWRGIDYYWRVRNASILRDMGLLYGQLAKSIIFKPSTDFLETPFDAVVPIGAYRIAIPPIVFERTTTRPHVLRVYYDGTRRTPQGNGSSWDKAYTSLDDILKTAGSTVAGISLSAVDENGKPYTYTIPDGDGGTLEMDGYIVTAGDSIEILVREGTYEPSLPYTYQENDPHSSCFNVIAPSSGASPIPLTILGGYPSYEDSQRPADSERNPAKHRTVFTGNASGTALDEGCYHVFRIETGADFTLDGAVVEKGYAAGTAFQPYGGAILVGSLYSIDAATKVTLRDCIVENNSAYYGAALAIQDDCRNASVSLVNCVVNNNQTNNDNIIETGDASNTLSLDYVTIVNNIGVAPRKIGTTSFAAGNETFNSSHIFATINANNTIDLDTEGKEGAANFANPSNKAGAAMNGNVYYGGVANYRPLTSSKQNDAIINRVATNDAVISHDIAGNDRNLGGAPDLGAYEALLPKAGKVIYVRSYNTDWTEDDCIDGTPDFNILNDNPGNVYDGLTWSRAIQGNAVCDTTLMNAEGNAMYVLDSGGRMLAATLDNTKYAADYNASTAPYGQTSNAYGKFFSSATSSKPNGNYTNQKRADGTLYNKITNNRDERYVSGLQIAIERAARYNAAHKNDADFEEMTVWVGAGVYTDFKGFVIRNGVKVYGGFPKDGNPGENERRPLLSQYVPARKGYEKLNKADYETILQIRKESPIYLTTSSREIWYSEGTSNGSKYDFPKKLLDAKTVERHYVLYQPDVCLPTYGVSGDGLNTTTGANQYRTADFPKYADPLYQEYKDVKWDGFSIRHGYITNYTANRDGGAGVRVFRGIRMENLIIVNNFTHGSRSRGGGMYLDGDNSIISNSFMLRNFVYGSNDNYGGGAYMIQGVGYNLVVASNRSWSRGGGIFIESAKFFNNTVAYNMAQTAEGAGIMHWQDATTGITSALTLYNCIVYNNLKNDDKDSNITGSTQVGSTSPATFHDSYNNYINGRLPDALASKFSAANGNVTTSNTPSMPYPFAIAGNDTRWSSSQGKDVDGGTRFSKARAANDFRLNEGDGLAGNPCLNGGTEDMPMVPATDMDYTDRIKDCTIDIGAYEADNTANITPQKKSRETTTTNADGTTSKTQETYYVYYVTETGYGNRSGSDPENAACAEKLQSVLTAAGELADSLDYKYKVYVKVAGYEPDEDGDRFVYHANTLADADDPQSYTFLVPQGVWMYGGYNEGTWRTDTTGTVVRRYLTGYNWDDDTRDVITSFQTVLSAKTQPREGSAVGEVTGYHTVSFGKWPKGDYADYALHALPGKTVGGKHVNPSTGIDGVRLIDGTATDNDGMKGDGGGAVVPAYAHVRNCVITDCQAIKGGALLMLPGGIVSGSVIHDNKARQGGAIYAANGKSLIEEYNEYRAYMASCTIAENSATEGGGIYQELGALFGGNSVIWGNTATTDKNISGVVDKQFKDLIHHSADPTSTVTEYFPYNRCFVERYLLPGDMGNVSMTSDFETYFATAAEYYPRPYSPLINNGVTKAYQRLWESLGVSTHDVKGVARGMKDKLTAGAYAMVLPDVPEGVLLLRLFVSADGGAEVSDEVKAKYVGRSFYTPFNSLDAALAYINHARTENLGTTTSPRYLASVDDRFEIFMTGGTYRPSVVRMSGDDVDGATVADRRMQSFELPLNVAIFGGFDNTDPYSSTPVTKQATGVSTQADDASSPLTEIETVNGDIIHLEPQGNTADLLNDRNTKHRADLNKNGLLEPWEFANPTIFSGDIKASENERKVYHVVYSNLTDEEKAKVKTESNFVLLDGITITNGETSDAVAEDDESQEDVSDIGHGGGLFSWNVNYTLNRCRVINNRGVHGGGIFIHDATLNLLGSAVSGNLASSELNEVSAGYSPGRGGGICATFTDSGTGSVRALNSLFANNTAEGNLRNTQAEGGAIYVNPGMASDASFQYLNVVNCNIVRNRSMHGAAVLVASNPYDENASPLLTNTVCWGNETLAQMSNGVYKPTAHMGLYDNQMSHCATGIRPAEPYENPTDPTIRVSSNGNIIIDRDNMAAMGPRFNLPSTTAGYEGFSMSARWNPAAISVLTDAGDGTLAKCDTLSYDQTFKAACASDPMAYMAWLRELPEYLTDETLCNYNMEYTNYEKETPTHRYLRFMGPLEEETGDMGVRPIDIGMYEFQYKFKMPDLPAVYIGTEERGDGSGENWQNQSTDLRGAIIAMANATGNNDPGKINTNRHVYVRGGEYYSPIMTGGDAFSLIVNTDASNRKFVTSVEIVGSCEGHDKDADGNEPQDFSKPTVIVPNPFVPESSPVNNLLNITANGRPVTVSGFSFRNTHLSTAPDANGEYGGRGITADVNNEGVDKNASLTLKNCAFEGNRDVGLNITGNDGKVLVYNTLFADGGADGMNTRGKTTVVNATFAQNHGYDFTTAAGGTTDVYNSVAWQNGGDSRKHSLADSETEAKDNRHNTSFAWNTPNEDVLTGPNFTSPATGDYSLRPSVMLFNTGDSTLYINNVMGIDAIDATKSYMARERDLLNVQRVVGGDIDRGAYECTSKLLPIIYVKNNTTQTGSGESWDKPTNNLQNAINLAELYANTSNGENASKAAYVFVDRRVVATEAKITLPGVKIYGTMDNETSRLGGDTDPTDYTKAQVDAIVADLLAKRKGIIEQLSQSRVSGLDVDYTPGDGSDNYSQLPCVVDGFSVDGDAKLKRGYLSTSILNATASLSGTAEGVLYNSLAYGKVADVRSVNVTAVKSDDVEGSGTLPDVVDSKGNGCAANRPNATLVNRYVDADHWRWQLNEFYTAADGTADYSKLNADINANADSTLSVACANAVCHRRDLAGNLRFRVFPSLTGDDLAFNRLDNGCFETWYVPTIYTATTADQPHGKTAIYVREEQRSTDDRSMLPFSELRLAPGLYTEASPFSPGFLLLKHHAGLRGNGNYISLDNLAVERELHTHSVASADGTATEEGYPDLCVMPFSTTRREQFERGTLELDGTNDIYTSYAYNELRRAAYDYKFDAVNGKAWEEAILSTDYPTQGLMIVPHKDFTLRFYTNSYNEHGMSAGINLLPYCFQEPWSTSSTGGVRFTHKENMGWNLFGSPFLCAMNYSDMGYGRVIYVDDILNGGGYTPLNTINADGSIAEGYIPAFDAVFTQTATLANYELMLAGHSAELSGDAYQGARTLTVNFAPSGATRAADGSGSAADALQLNAVDNSDAHTDFDLSSDGVKWMNAENAQIYAVNGNGRYSLLSAVSREGEVKVGVSVPAAGMYTFSIPADCDTDGYEAVLLKDKKTNKAVDLLDDAYQFTATEAGEQNSRFTITFTKSATGKEGIYIKKLARGRIYVGGLSSGDEVSLYSADGRLLNTQCATGSTLTMSCASDGIVVVDVTRDGRQVAVRKVR